MLRRVWTLASDLNANSAGPPAPVLIGRRVTSSFRNFFDASLLGAREDSRFFSVTYFYACL